MKNNLEIQEIIGGLRKAFQFHGLPWRPYQYDVLSDGSLKLPLPSDKRAYVICRTVISRPTVEKYRLLLATELKDGAEIVFAATSFTQPFIDSYHEKNIHFYSLNGACRITLPSIITYIVKIQTGSQRQSRNNGGTPFVGKGAMLPRLFFNQPQRIWTLGELANVAAMTKPYASIIVHRMMDNDYVRQEGNGYLLVNPEKMLDDWMAVYRFNRYVHFGFMGASGAYLRAPYMESRTVMAYVEQIPDNLSGLFPVESDGNVILYIPQNTGFFFGGKEVDGLPVVSDVQLYLDLKRMPGRNADQADYLRDSLLNWSKQHA